LHKVHSKVCRSVPEKCPARCGRASSEHGTSDRQDVQSPRAARWTTAVEIGAYASFEQTSVQNSRSPRMSQGASGNATVCRSGYRLAVQYCSISETCFHFFSAICFPRKRTARLSPAVQVREETPGEGQRWRRVSGHRVSYCANPRAPSIDEAQFSAQDSYFEWRPFVLLPITSAEHGHLVPEGMRRQP
jgi:hypothetical protein